MQLKDAVLPKRIPDQAIARKHFKLTTRSQCVQRQSPPEGVLRSA